jgi:hypothetical protein
MLGLLEHQMLVLPLAVRNHRRKQAAMIMF